MLQTPLSLSLRKCLRTIYRTTTVRLKSSTPQKAGADAIKLQTYTADTMTVDSDADCFINKGGLWDGIKEYDLYKQAYTPWEWHAGLMEEAKNADCSAFPPL